MNRYEHLPLNQYQGEVQRQTQGGGGGFKIPEGRTKSGYVKETEQKVERIVSSFNSVKAKYLGIINPSLIFEIEINQGVDFKTLEQTMSSMGIHILSSAENKKGYWVVFGDDMDLERFKTKLKSYGSPEGPKYDFFNAFGVLRDIPKEEKIGAMLKNNPLNDTAEFIDIELWRMTDNQKNQSFINELKIAYPNPTEFRITDQIITKSFVLLRVKLTKTVFDEIIELKEIARVDRPSIPVFNPFDLKNLDLKEIEKVPPDESASGILIIDSGIIANHPLLDNCIGAEENYQNGETATHDTVGHGTAVAGCAAYGGLERCLSDNQFIASNWIFSAKVMYAETNTLNGQVRAIYDPEKLVEHQLKDAVEDFLTNLDYQIRVVNISLGNSNEIWHKNYTRQLPLASIIDELAYMYPNVVFIISTGNQDPLYLDGHETIEMLKTNYPKYLIQNDNCKIVNPATSALALTVGSIAQPINTQIERFGEEQIKIPIADENQPSPFTRTGPGINGMIKPELVEYGGNLILYNNSGRISEDVGGKLLLLSSKASTDLLRFDSGTSFSAPKISHIAGQIANRYPQRSANYIKNMLLSGANYPFIPDDNFYGSKEGKALSDHLNVSGFGVPSLERAINSFDNRVVLFDESTLQLNKVKVYQIQIPEDDFNSTGNKRIISTLTFTPETRLTRGDSYLGNRMKLYLFHSINPQVLVESFGVVESNEDEILPENVKRCKIEMFPGISKCDKGCHQKYWVNFKKKNIVSPISLVLINNKWMNDENTQINYCLSVVFEHETNINLYNKIRANIQTRARVR